MSQTSNQSNPHVPHVDDDSLAVLRAPLPPPERAPSQTFQNWAYFGGAVMAVLGVSWAFLGFIALVDEEYFTVRANSLLTFEGYAAWGWAHMVGGVLALAAGIGILWGGHRWARTLGIVVAGLSAVVNLGFLSAAPFWSTLLIALNVVVIYALTVHGAEIDDS
jgi:hypothetical protein